MHDDQGHDEEADIHQDDHQHWYNERPHKVSVRIQPASAGNQTKKVKEGWLTVQGVVIYPTKSVKMQYLFVYIRIYLCILEYNYYSILTSVIVWINSY